MNNYHNIYLPLLDVFEAGGPTTFTNLSRKEKGQKNLIVLTSQILNELRTQDKKGSQSAYDIGEFIRTNFKTPLEFKNKEGGIGAHGFDLSDGVDVMILQDEQSSRNRFDDGQSSLVSRARDIQEKIHSLAKSSKDSIDFLTSNNYDATALKSQNLHQSKPSFLMANAEIVRKGLIKASNDFKADFFSNNGSLSLERASEHFDEELHPNQFIDLGKGMYVRVTGDIIRSGDHNLYIKGINNLRVDQLPRFALDRKLKLGDYPMKNVLGVTPRDMEQYLALQYCLFDPNITTSFITGGQGSGKTLLAYAAAIDMMLQYNAEPRKLRTVNRNSTAKNGFYDKLILMKPLTQVGGDELGFLPGDIEKKLSPYLDPFRDAHGETILPQNNFPTFDSLFKPSDDSENQDKIKKGYPARNFGSSIPAHPPREGSLEYVFYGMSRGRSLHNTLLIVDEAQNMKPYMLKTLIERAALGSKIVLLGDPFQVDASSGCTPDMNGLTHAYKHLIHQPHTAGIHLSGHYRSHDSKSVSDWKVYK